MISDKRHKNDKKTKRTGTLSKSNGFIGTFCTKRMICAQIKE